LYDVVDRALQLHGGLGFSTDMPLEAMYRFARHARFVDGADEVHRESIARQILKGYQAPEDGVPTEYVPARRETALLTFAALVDVEGQLGPVDLWVNNAGIPSTAQAERVLPRAEQQLVEAAGGEITTPLDAVLRLPDEEWRRMLAVHLDGTFYGTRAAARSM